MSPIKLSSNPITLVTELNPSTISVDPQNRLDSNIQKVASPALSSKASGDTGVSMQSRIKANVSQFFSNLGTKISDAWFKIFHSKTETEKLSLNFKSEVSNLKSRKQESFKKVFEELTLIENLPQSDNNLMKQNLPKILDTDFEDLDILINTLNDGTVRTRAELTILKNDIEAKINIKEQWLLITKLETDIANPPTSEMLMNIDFGIDMPQETKKLVCDSFALYSHSEPRKALLRNAIEELQDGKIRTMAQLDEIKARTELINPKNFISIQSGQTTFNCPDQDIVINDERVAQIKENPPTVFLIKGLIPSVRTSMAKSQDKDDALEKDINRKFLKIDGEFAETINYKMKLTEDLKERQIQYLCSQCSAVDPVVQLGNKYKDFHVKALYLNRTDSNLVKHDHLEEESHEIDKYDPEKIGQIHLATVDAAGKDKPRITYSQYFILTDEDLIPRAIVKATMEFTNLDNQNLEEVDAICILDTPIPLPELPEGVTFS